LILVLFSFRLNGFQEAEILETQHRNLKAERDRLLAERDSLSQILEDHKKFSKACFKAINSQLQSQSHGQSTLGAGANGPSCNSPGHFQQQHVLGHGSKAAANVLPAEPHEAFLWNGVGQSVEQGLPPVETLSPSKNAAADIQTLLYSPLSAAGQPEANFEDIVHGDFVTDSSSVLDLDNQTVSANDQQGQCRWVDGMSGMGASNVMPILHDFDAPAFHAEAEMIHYQGYPAGPEDGSWMNEIHRSLWEAI
jgi:hypothetical protein